jgi:hypothetical protein
MKSDQEAFETVFGRFIEAIGGEILAEGPEETADFLFRVEKIVVELKTLQRDSRDEHAKKLAALMATWAKRGLLWVIGRTVVNLRNVHPQAQREWLDLLETPIEGIIRKANRQIRSTKMRERLPDAKGLLLIVNDGNFLVGVPEEFMTLVARVLQKRTRSGEPKFPHIRGVVYFSYRIVAAGEKNLFWLPGTIEPAADSVMQIFQSRLRTEWVAYFSRITRRPISEEFRALPPSD